MPDFTGLAVPNAIRQGVAPARGQHPVPDGADQRLVLGDDHVRGEQRDAGRRIQAPQAQQLVIEDPLRAPVVPAAAEPAEPMDLLELGSPRTVGRDVVVQRQAADHHSVGVGDRPDPDPEPTAVHRAEVLEIRILPVQGLAVVILQECVGIGRQDFGEQSADHRGGVVAVDPDDLAEGAQHPQVPVEHDHRTVGQARRELPVAQFAVRQSLLHAAEHRDVAQLHEEEAAAGCGEHRVGGQFRDHPVSRSGDQLELLVQVVTGAERRCR